MAVLTEAGAAPAATALQPRRWRLSRVALTVLLVGTAVLYVWGLGSSGWANSFYSAAVQAGSQSWKAFLFGSSDAANSITVDKPPMSLWVMAASVRIFGLSSWSILVPQALMAVASVALLWDTVRRRFGEAAGLIAGLLLALTPIVFVIFRYNNPDALLVLLMLAAVWAVLRVVDDGRTGWLILCGVLVGAGYLTKQLQVALVMPAIGAVYLTAGPSNLRKRLWQVGAGVASAVVAAGWWVALVQLWPAADRPWIGGSQHNSILELTFGYNGFGRLTGDERGSVGPGGPGREAAGGAADAPMHGWGSPGIFRLFQAAQVGQIGWLLVTALVFAVALLIWRWRAPRTDLQRASVLAWTLWLLCTAAVFSFMAGIFHPYYTVALAPPIAALTGIGIAVTVRHRTQRWAQAVIVAATVAAATTSFLVLGHTPGYYPWLRWAVLAAAAVPVIWVLGVRFPWARRTPMRTAAALAAVVVGLSGPLAYISTTLDRHTSGAMPSAGPAVQQFGRGEPGAPFGPGAPLGPPGAGGPPGRMRGCNLLDAGRPEAAVLERITTDSTSYTWIAATIGSSCASGYQLATGLAVMPIGGFNGSDPSPSLPDFQRLVAQHQIHYFIASAKPDAEDKSAESNTSGSIEKWVQQAFGPIALGAVTLYDLTKPHQ